MLFELTHDLCVMRIAGPSGAARENGNEFADLQLAASERQRVNNLMKSRDFCSVAATQGNQQLGVCRSPVR